MERCLTGMLLLVCLLTACKKHSVAPNDIIETDFPVQIAVAAKVNNAVDCYYQALPVHYAETSKAYPLLVFIHGAGQIGNGLVDIPLLLNDGVAALIAKKKFPPSFTVNGKNFSFIVLTPQFSHYPSSSEVEDFVNYALTKYRIDHARIYISGLSMGGFVTAGMGGAYTSQLAAIAPLAGVSDDSTVCRNIAGGNLPVWVFHNNGDPSIDISTVKAFVAEINYYNPGTLPKLTVFNAFVHDAWTEAIDPAYREDGKNMYEWMLQYTR